MMSSAHTNETTNPGNDTLWVKTSVPIFCYIQKGWVGTKQYWHKKMLRLFVSCVSCSKLL